MSKLEKINEKIEKGRDSIEKLQTKLEEKKTKREWIKNNIDEFLAELEVEETKIIESISKKEITLQKDIEKQTELQRKSDSIKDKEIEEYGEYIEVESAEIDMHLDGYCDECYDEIGFEIELSNGDYISGTTKELYCPFSSYRKHVYFNTIWKGIQESKDFDIDKYSDRVQDEIYKACYEAAKKEMLREWGSIGDMR